MIEIDGVNLRNIVIDTVIVGTVAYAFNIGDIVGVAAYTITNIAVQAFATQYNSALRNSCGVALGLYVSYGCWL